MSHAEQNAAERLKPLLWAGALGAALSAFAGMFGFHDGSVWRMPRALEARVEAALLIVGYPGLDVEMDGQRAIVRGIVDNDGAIAIVGRTALQAAGAGGAWSGGVTSVDVSGVTVGAIERPFVWSARRDDNRIILFGAVPSETARADLLATASASFPNAEAVDDMRVAGGAPSANWSDMARHVLRALATLNTGEARMRDAHIALVGDGSYEAVERLRQAYAAPVTPFRAHVAATVDGLDLVYPELQGIDLRDGSAPACARAFTRVSERGDIEYAASSAAIAASSLPSIQAIASVALRCDNNSIIVRGPAEGGANLSLQRAQTVAAQLVNEGVSPEHVQAAPGAGRRTTFTVESGPNP